MFSIIYSITNIVLVILIININIILIIKFILYTFIFLNLYDNLMYYNLNMKTIICKKDKDKQ